MSYLYGSWNDRINGIHRKWTKNSKYLLHAYYIPRFIISPLKRTEHLLGAKAEIKKMLNLTFLESLKKILEAIKE